MVDIMPTLLGLAGGAGSSEHPFDGKDIWPTLAEGKPSPHEDILINVEAIRGAIRKGNWKLVKRAPLPGRTELYALAAAPGEQHNLAAQHPDIVRDLEERLRVIGILGEDEKTAFLFMNRIELWPTYVFHQTMTRRPPYA